MAPSPQDQEKALQKFREELVKQDLIHDGDTIGTDDATLRRFLRARGFNLKQAIQMWRSCQNWRKTVDGVGIDELYRRMDPYDYPERDWVFDCWPLYFHKTDKKGRPLNIHRFGGINMPKLYEHVSPARFWQTVLVNAESLTREVLPASTRAAGKHVDGTFVIVDLKGFGLSQFWQMKNFARDAFQVSQDYYPETMAQLAIINAPSSFTTIWSFIKPWLAKETVAKVCVLGSDYVDRLREWIDPENLPTYLGGSCTCSEFGGCEKGNAGPWMEARSQKNKQQEGGEQQGQGEEQMKESAHARGQEAHGDSEPEADTDTDTPSSVSSSPAPSTPPLDETMSDKFQDMSLNEEHGADTRAGRPTSVKRQLSREESVEKVQQEHPETREVQTGDLHSKTGF